MGRLIIVFIIGMVTGLSSCDETSCFVEDPKLRIGFSTVFNENTRDTLLNELYVKGIGGADSLLYDSAINIGQIELPLSPANDSTSFSIQIGNTTDVLTVFYDKEPHQISLDCGYNFFYTITRGTTTLNNFDSVLVINPAINEEFNQNIQIFL
jgi:hypothetical protein